MQFMELITRPIALYPNPRNKGVHNNKARLYIYICVCVYIYIYIYIYKYCINQQPFAHLIKQIQSLLQTTIIIIYIYIL